MENPVMQLVVQELPQFKALFALNAGSDTDVETLALQELDYLRMRSITLPVILDCIPETIISAVKSVIKENLSLDPHAELVYVKTRNVQVAGQWRKALEIIKTVNGLISVNRQCGRILDIERPEVEKDITGKVIGVSIRLLKPSFDEQGRSITRWVTVQFDEDDFYRWRRSSHKENSRSYENLKPDQRNGKKVPNSESLNYANENYTNWNGGIDPEFARAKAIRHALKKLGTNQHEGRLSRHKVENANYTIVDQVADVAAAFDDGCTAAEYPLQDDVPPDAKEEPGTLFSIPNADEL